MYVINNTVKIIDRYFESIYVPRFKLDTIEIFNDFKINTPYRFDESKLIKAIEYGMLLEIDYKGEGDDLGHDRIILPLYYCLTKENKAVIVGYHYRGFSLSNDGEAKKIFRTFRVDSIISMSFIGAFEKDIPPKFNDTTNIKKTITKIDFDLVKANIKKLVNDKKLRNTKDLYLKSPTIKVKDTNTELFFNDLSKYPFPDKINCTLLKSVAGNKYIIIFNILLSKNNRNIYSDNLFLGLYKPIKYGTLEEVAKTSNETKSARLYFN